MNSDVFENFNQFMLELVKINKNHEKNTLKISFSNIHSIEIIKLPHVNTVLFISDSHLNKIQPQSLASNSKVELNMLNVTASSVNWLNLLDSSRLKLLNLRNIPNMYDEFNAMNQLFPIVTIIDLKIYHTFLPILDENFFLFKTIKYIEQMEFIGCSISQIKNGTFSNYKTRFRYLKSLIISNNNLTQIKEETFIGLSNLVQLDLDDNPIEFIADDAFKHLKKLKILSLNNNIKLVDLISNLVWLTTLLNLKQERSLNEISLKSSLWTKDFCVLHNVVSHLKIANEQIQRQKNNTIEKTRHLRLFFDDDFDEKNQDDDSYCNINFICKYSNSHTASFWQVDTINSCNRIFKAIAREKRCSLRSILSSY